MKASKNIFMTGATGSIGREFIRLFLNETQDHLTLIVRPKPGFSHEERMERILAKMGINGKQEGRLTVFKGDVTQPRMGLAESDWNRVLSETDEFYHIAALTNLGAGWEEAEKINLQGTVHALALAQEACQKGRLKRFFYFSTAYVAGSLTPVRALEDELPENPAFANNYEATKFLAEKKVREEMAAGLPAVIFRPSIVVGDSERGVISEFNVIYPFLRLFAHGLLRKIPSRRQNVFNIVPIDFVVRAAFWIAVQERSLGKTFHLVSENPPTLEMLLEIKEEYGDFPPVEVVSPDEFSVNDLKPEERQVFTSLDPYLGYLTSSLSFDTRNTRQVLEGSGIEFPRTDRNFLRKIVGYAIEKGYFLRSA